MRWSENSNPQGSVMHFLLTNSPKKGSTFSLPHLMAHKLMGGTISMPHLFSVVLNPQQRVILKEKFGKMGLIPRTSNTDTLCWSLGPTDSEDPRNPQCHYLATEAWGSAIIYVTYVSWDFMPIWLPWKGFIFMQLSYRVCFELLWPVYSAS